MFVANPNKTKPTQDILLKNKDKLVEFLTQFHNDRTGSYISSCLQLVHTHMHTHTDDQQFNDEKAYLIKQIREMTPVPVPPVDGGAAV